jgi:hypothetical protein
VYCINDEQPQRRESMMTTATKCRSVSGAMLRRVPWVLSLDEVLHLGADLGPFALRRRTGHDPRTRKHDHLHTQGPTTADELFSFFYQMG